MTVNKTKLIDAVNILNETEYKDENGNEVSLLQETIPMDNPDNAVALMTAFKVACESIPESLENHIPDSVSDVYNGFVDDDWKLADSSETEIPEKKEKKKKENGKTKADFLRNLISTGTMTRKEIIDAVQEQFPNASKLSTASFITHAKSLTGKSPLGKRIIIDANGILKFAQEGS